MGVLAKMLPRFLQRKQHSVVTLNDLLSRLDAGGYNTAAGVTVTAETAMRETTVFACVRIISEMIAQLPVHHFRREGDMDVQVENSQELEVLRYPNDFQTAHEYKQLMVTDVELRGNHYDFKVKDGAGTVRELLPLSNASVSLNQNDDWSIVYQVFAPYGTIASTFTTEQIMHSRNISLNGYDGLSTISAQRGVIGLRLATTDHGSSVFRNGAQVAKSIEMDGKLDEEARKILQADMAKYQGALASGKTIFLDQGMKLKEVGMSNDDSQFLETRSATKADIGLIYGIPLFMLNEESKGPSTVSGLEQVYKSLLASTFAPRLNRYAETFKRNLLPRNRQDNEYFKFDTSAFTLRDFAEMVDAYSKGVQTGLFNPDEARAGKTFPMNPRADGFGGRYRHMVNTELDRENEGGQDAVTDT